MCGIAAQTDRSVCWPGPGWIFDRTNHPRTGYLRDAIVTFILVISVFVFAAYIMASIIGMDYLDVMLAFVPGGLYEVTLLSLIFGFDVAFVAIHHGTRMLFILFSLPIVFKYLRAPPK